MATTVLERSNLAVARSPSTASLERLIEQAAHLLPSQGPISVFVHHNTLHALEEMKFADALVHSVETYQCQPYLPEERYRQELARGRIRREDLAAVLQDDLSDNGDELIGLLGTRFYLRLAMLEHSLYTGPSEELRWIIAETDAARAFRPDVPAEVRKRIIEHTRRWIMREFRNGHSHATVASYSPKLVAVVGELLDSFGKACIEEWSEATWEAFTLQLMWRLCVDGASVSASPRVGRPPLRHRDVLLEAVDEDCDDLVHEMLIRFCAVFLDQGFAHWPLPERDKGFYLSFIELYGAPGCLAPRWLRGLRAEVARLKEDAVGPLESIEESLELLGVGADEREEFIATTLMALRGWAGMIWQMETNAEWAVRPAPQGTLAEFLAVRLILDRFAAVYVAQEQMGYRGDLRDLRTTALRRRSLSVNSGEVQRAFLFFQLAQTLGLSPEDLQRLPSKTWSKLSAEVEAFSELERRRTLHYAYERRYLNQTLDAVAAHAKRAYRRLAAAGPQPTPDFQMFFCIDDREESFRRHLEEVHPACETFGYAAFFNVAMYYRGASDAHARPLCPVVIKPKHYVEELPVFTFEEAHRRRALARRWLGSASHYIHRGSRSLVGGAFTAIVGSLASAPLVGRILFPRTAAQLRRMFGTLVRPPEVTQLLLERSEPTPGPEEGHIGYSVGEMADIVERSLRDTGLTSRFAPLVIMTGHGSSSLNNPHESAYNCGACSGGRGGPNARAFSQMANDPRVRAILAERGLRIPHATYFLGAYHNTCNDQVAFFELERLPLTHKEVFARARRAIDETRRRNAHERCRRFESASLAISPEAALAHVEERAEDLSQARPEYNHATNAITFVGRRDNVRGLFMDRRTFLASYDPTLDDQQGTILARILAAVIPVCAGISLEYYFSCVDPQGYGCGSKLPHNIVSLLGVMEGALTDLRTGLSVQMIEIHEPVRQLFIIETKPETMEQVIKGSPTIARLCNNEWVFLATLDPQDKTTRLYRNGKFEPYQPESHELPQVYSSVDWYRGWRDNLGYAEVADLPSAARGSAAEAEIGAWA
ncbi:MAG: DUF2309 domain-containing protein [Pirellulales bacterium]|nr:DUF2309 domain-containing protein [Pirellulales bacterium]